MKKLGILIIGIAIGITTLHSLNAFAQSTETLIVLREVGGFTQSNNYVIYDSTSHIISKITGGLMEGRGSMIANEATPEQKAEFESFAKQFVNIPVNSTINPNSTLNLILYVLYNNSVKYIDLTQFDTNDIGGVNVTKFLKNFVS